MMMLSDMEVETEDDFSEDESGNEVSVVRRLFRRKLMQADEFDNVSLTFLAAN